MKKNKYFDLCKKLIKHQNNFFESSQAFNMFMLSTKGQALQHFFKTIL